MKKLFLFLFLLSSVIVFPQGNQFMDQIKSLIGDTIDVDERSFYELFTDVRDFQKAIIFTSEDSCLDFRIYNIQQAQLKDSLYTKVCTDKNFLEDLKSTLKKRETETRNSVDEKITMLLRNGEILSGELLTASRDEIHFYELKSNFRSEEELSANRLIKKNDIREIIIKGESKRLTGGIIGLCGGLFAGAILAAIISSSGGLIVVPFWEVAPNCMIKFGLLGTLLGAIIGEANSEDDIVINVNQYFNFAELRKYCSEN